MILNKEYNSRKTNMRILFLVVSISLDIFSQEGNFKELHSREALQVNFFNSARKKRIVSKNNFRLLKQKWKDAPNIDEIENVIYNLKTRKRINSHAHFLRLKKVLNRLVDVDYEYYIKENLGDSYYRIQAAMLIQLLVTFVIGITILRIID